MRQEKKTVGSAPIDLVLRDFWKDSYSALCGEKSQVDSKQQRPHDSFKSVARSAEQHVALSRNNST